jgi:chemotaxis protein CheX
MGAPKINASHPFMNRDVILNLSNGMTATLKMMANVDSSFEKPYTSTHWKSPKEISVYLILDTDAYKGQVLFHFDKDVAKKIIENMVGSAIAEDSADILDGVGEISNIFYGAAKTKIKEAGIDLNMTIPKPCWTKDLTPITNKSISMIIPFKIENKDCYVEIIIF